MIIRESDIVVGEGSACLVAMRVELPVLNKSKGIIEYEAVPGSEVASLTWKLVNDDDNAVINGKDGINITSLVDENGWLELWMEAADNPIVESGDYPPGTQEPHKILFILTSTSGHETPIEKMVYVKSMELVS